MLKKWLAVLLVAMMLVGCQTQEPEEAIPVEVDETTDTEEQQEDTLDTQEPEIDEAVEEAAVLEVKGVVVTIGEASMEVETDSDRRLIDLPEGMDVSEYGVGDPVVLAADVTQDQWVLRFIASDDQRMDPTSGLDVIRHIGRLERIGTLRMGMDLNGAYLEMYHNEKLPSQAQVGDLVYVEYVADYKSESNEVIFIQIIE